MELEAGKKYLTEYGIGLAFDSDRGYMKMYFNNVEATISRGSMVAAMSTGSPPSMTQLKK